jgi:ssDNA-binding Zn-finger/Zn-ribbon topoisomerase 1
VKKTFRCKECGTQLASKEHLKKHQKFHKQSAWKEAGYVDPNNATYPTIANPTNSRLAFFISNLLARMKKARKRKERINVTTTRQ